MKTIKKMVLVLAGISFLLVALSYAQPKILKQNIPSDIPSEVRKQIERLYPQNPRERGAAADELGKMGVKAVSAVPFLIGILGDNTPIREYLSVSEQSSLIGKR